MVSCREYACMVVVHDLSYVAQLGLCFMVWSMIICFVIVICLSASLVYDLIYEYVCKELDKCTYFGVDYERVSKS